MDGYISHKENQRRKYFQNFKTVHVMAIRTFGDTLNNLNTRPLQNAKVMAREKQGETAEKVTSMGKNPLLNLEEQFILSNLAIAVALVLLSFIERGSLVKTQLKVK